MKLLSEYVKKFNANDNVLFDTFISNGDAYGFLSENAPVLSCPDKDIEETFAFREWTFRKHIKKVGDGAVITEFLSDVPWAGKHNTIYAGLFHHINEGRWFKGDFLMQYIDFYMHDENKFVYSTPAIYEIINYLFYIKNYSYLEKNIELFEKQYALWEKTHSTDSGLFWSYDGFDGMEYSISGRNANLVSQKGIRPTLNSYMYAGLISLNKAEKFLNRKEKAEEYLQKANALKKLFNERTWDGDFFKAIHGKKLKKDISCSDIPEKQNVKELIGYIPWIYGLAENGKEKAFLYLLDEKVFKGKTGLTTADISNERFLYKANHECLWNGYVWPYGISQTVNAVINLKESYNSEIISDKELYEIILQYAKMHKLKLEDGREINFIDEVMHPFESVWTAREILKEEYIKTGKGYPERGKDYNHSTFIDLVLRGLIGIDVQSEELKVRPRVKGIWKWFAVYNLPFRDKTFNIFYDENGEKYNKGKGVIIEIADKI